MIPQPILNALERRGLVAFLFVLLFAGAAGAQAQSPAPAQPGMPAAMAMKMGEMKLACAAKHEAAAVDVQALTKTVTEARRSNDVMVLRAALDATLRHLEDMQAKAAKCAAMMKVDASSAEPAKGEAAHKH